MASVMTRGFLAYLVLFSSGAQLGCDFGGPRKLILIAGFCQDRANLQLVCVILGSLHRLWNHGAGQEGMDLLISGL